MENDINTAPIVIHDQSEIGMRLDKLLASRYTCISRMQIQKLIKEGQVTVNEKVVTELKYGVQLSDTIRCHITSHVQYDTLVPYDFALDVVYEDDDILVIDKPAGLLVHPGAGNKDKTLANALFAAYGDNLSDISGAFRLGIVHRLDKDTSGLMVVAKNNQSHLFLAQQLEERQIERLYWAFIYGVLFPMRGTIQSNIGRSKKDRTKMAVLRSGGKHAVTHYEVLESFGDSVVSLVQCKLDTGRTHQIRVHMSFRKYPIVGDRAYRASRTFHLTSLNSTARIAVESLQRQALHAVSLKFTHPTTLQTMHFQSALPADLESLLQALRAKA